MYIHIADYYLSGCFKSPDDSKYLDFTPFTVAAAVTRCAGYSAVLVSYSKHGSGLLFYLCLDNFTSLQTSTSCATLCPGDSRTCGGDESGLDAPSGTPMSGYTITGIISYPPNVLLFILFCSNIFF